MAKIEGRLVPAGTGIDVASVAARHEPGKFAYIDQCRGIAILMVIIVHHSESFTYNFYIRYIAMYGQMGVQFFFIASAVTLCLSIDARRSETSHVRNFYMRRLFRIAPLYYLGLLIYAGLAAAPIWTGFNAQLPLYSPANIIENLLFVHGFSPIAYNGIVPGGWSIGTEMAFYLLFPALFGLYASAYRRWGMRALLLAPMGMTALNLLILPELSRFGLNLTNGSFLYCNIVNQLPVFLIGISGFFAIRDGLSDRVRPVLKAIGVVTLTLAGMLLLAAATPRALILLQPVAGLAFFLLLDLLRVHVLRARLIGTVGQVSYSMYIFHFLFAWTMTRAILKALAHVPHVLILCYLPTLILTVLLSYGVGRWSKAHLEDPFIAIGKLWIARMSATAPTGSAEARRRGAA